MIISAAAVAEYRKLIKDRDPEGILQRALRARLVDTRANGEEVYEDYFTRFLVKDDEIVGIEKIPRKVKLGRK